MNKKLKFALAAVVAASAVFLCAVFSRLPEVVYVTADSEFNYNNGLLTTRELSSGSVLSTANETDGQSRNAVLMLFDVIPLKAVRVVSIERCELIPCGVPFGIKMFSDGVLVVGFSDVVTALGKVCPAEECGLKLGDIILSVGGKSVASNNAVSEAVAESEGREIQVVAVRDSKRMTFTLKPVYALDGSGCKAGMWVRDSTAGLGTATYIDAHSGIIAGLGHAVADSDTGAVIPLLSGQLVKASIVGVTRGVAGKPGELKGAFTYDTVAQLIHNGETGIFGQLTAEFYTADAIPIALKHEVKTGAAYIITTVSGSTPKAYSVKIEKIFLSDNSLTQNYIIRVTDPDLLAATGGIVQGMSGSPVIQNGRLVGAVTHVFVNDPTRGYGIFAENMLETQRRVAAQTQLDAAA